MINYFHIVKAQDSTIRLLMCHGFLSLMLLLLVVVPLHAAIITVDAADGTVFGNGECSINEAIEMANSNSLNTECILVGILGNDDTIKLTQNVTISASDQQVPFSANGKNATKSITSVITIDGNGYQLSRKSENTCTLDGENTTDQEFRLLHVAANGNLTIKDLTLENGCADGNAGQSQGTDNGGAIYNLGSLVVQNSTISQSKCWGEGGGIYNGLGGTLVITKGVLSANRASKNGGGLSNNGQAVISNTTFSGNSVNGAVSEAGKGGGIYHYDGTISSISATTFYGNTTSNTFGGAKGGALYIMSDITEITNSTFSGNTSGAGAAIIMDVKSDNGLSTTVTSMTNNTFSGNFSSTDRAIANLGASVQNYLNNIVEGEGAPHCVPTGVWGSINASNNLDDGSCPGTPVGTITNFDMTLKDNGGPTMTHALLEDSNAIDAGDAAMCPEFDQRGYVRMDDSCDIGAYEYGAFPPGTSTTGPNSLLLFNE